MSLPTIHVVGAAILRGKTCLVAQRGQEMSLPLKWEFPGGKVMDHESPREALEREIAEEFSVEARVYERIGQGISEVNWQRIWLEVFRAEIVSGDLVLQEHEAIRWVGADGIEDLDWAEADVPVIPAVKALLAGSRRTTEGQ